MEMIHAYCEDIGLLSHDLFISYMRNTLPEIDGCCTRHLKWGAECWDILPKEV